MASKIHVSVPHTAISAFKSFSALTEEKPDNSMQVCLFDNIFDEKIRQRCDELHTEIISFQKTSSNCTQDSVQ